MNIVVLGGAGDMGSHIVKNVVAYSDARVTIADYQVSKAQKLARALGERTQGVFVDAGNRDSLLLALRDADVAVGAIGPFYRYAPKMAWAALESQIDYVDICDDHGPIDILFEFDAVARNVGTTLITGLGWTPGLSNILARKGAAELDEVDEIRIAWVGSAADAEGLAVVKHVLYAVSGQVPTYRDGQLIQVPALSESERVTFPEPLGDIEVSHVGHPEPVTIPKTIPTRTVSLKGALTPGWNNQLAKLVVRLGLTSSPGRADFVSRLIHRLEGVIGAGGVDLSGVRVDVFGTRGGEEMRLTYSAVDKMGRLTGVPAAVGALMLGRGEIQAPGVFAPEAIIDPVSFLSELGKHGIEIVEEETVAPPVATERAAVEVPAEVIPAPTDLPADTLTGDRVVVVKLDLERGRQESLSHVAETGSSIPSGVLRADEPVEVHLAVAQKRPMKSVAEAPTEAE